MYNIKEEKTSKDPWLQNLGSIWEINKELKNKSWPCLSAWQVNLILYIAQPFMTHASCETVLESLRRSHIRCPYSRRSHWWVVSTSCCYQNIPCDIVHASPIYMEWMNWGQKQGNQFLVLKSLFLFLLTNRKDIWTKTNCHINRYEEAEVTLTQINRNQTLMGRQRINLYEWHINIVQIIWQEDYNQTKVSLNLQMEKNILEICILWKRRWSIITSIIVWFHYSMNDYGTFHI